MTSRSTTTTLTLLLLAACSSADGDAKHRPTNGGGGSTPASSGDVANGSEATSPASASALARPSAGSCGLADPAFCETFDTPHPGGRGVDLDEARFGVARLTSNSNPGQGLFEGWSPGNAIVCGAMTNGILPGNDFRVCNGQLNDSFNDGGAFAFHSTMIRQPFDFAGRTGTIVFDVDAKSVGHGWWTEVWMSDEPVAGPYQSSPGVDPIPRNAFGVQILGDFCPGGNQGEQTSVHNVFVFQDYKLLTDSQGGAIDQQNCISTKDQVLNHFELKVSQDRIELRGSDAGDPSTMKVIGSVTGLQLPFTRGYVHFQHTHYNAAKVDVSSTQTYRWDNLGFDGPMLPTIRTYEAPDATSMAGDNRNFGYMLENDGSKSLSLEVDGVDVTNATAAWLHFSARSMVSGALLQFRVNGGSWHDDPQRDADATDSTRTEHLPVPLGELHAGKNTVELRGTNSYMPFVIANVDISVEGK